MKRWIRRILMGCSIALMVAAVGLWVRGLSLWDEYIVGRVGIANYRDAVGFMVYRESDFRQFTMEWSEPFSWLRLLPRVIITNEIGAIAWVILPHWLLLAVGAAYPTLAWLQHRRRKKDVGFPVEVKT